MDANEISPPVAGSHDTNGDPGKIFVGGLCKITNADRLKEYFSKYGEIKECLVMRDPVTKNSRCFGFVTFQDPASVEDVVNSGPHTLDDQAIDPKVAIPKRPQPKVSINNYNIKFLQRLIPARLTEHSQPVYIKFA